LAVAAFAGALLASCGEGPPAKAGEAHAEAEGAHADIVHISEADAQAAGVVVSTVESGPVTQTLSLPAQIHFDPDRIARISTPIAGVVSRLPVSEGDRVRRGAVLVVITSRELADIKAEYLDSVSAEALSKSEAARAETLWAERATSQASLETARAALARAVAARESAETKLHAIDIGHDVIDQLAHSADGARSLYSLTSPIAGQVVSRAATLGEAVGSGENAEKALFVVADSSVVWANIAVYRQDLGKVAIGAAVDIADDGGADLGKGKISFISPVIDETSRTTTARVVVDNAAGRLRPGQFVTARLAVGAGAAVVRVPEDAVQTVEGGPAVFVPHSEGFEVRPVRPGNSADGMVEIAAGLSAGDRYVSKGAFTLKAEFEKSAFGDGHSH
jgi:cobalt-zinc-cadmium efflux system membrane fusion protein